jgi:hypothetical protein
MLRFLADENFSGPVVRGVLRKEPEANIIFAQNVGLAGTSDEIILEWAAQEGRILLTHDVNTMTKYAYERIVAGLSMPGVIEIPRRTPLGVAIEDLLLVIGASEPSDWENKVAYLPF